MISVFAVRLEASALMAQDPECGSITALKLALVRAILKDPDLDGNEAEAMIRLNAVFEAKGWQTYHLLERWAGSL